MKPLRLGTAVSAVALAGILAGCAAPMSRNASVAKGKANLAYALRAQMAIGSGDYTSAVDLAERAAESSPQDAGIRGLLGNAYFGAGRFASAEAAYNDSLALAPGQPQIILKRVLVQIAQGKNGEAVAALQAAQGMIDPADYGLALALAGQPYDAVQVLETAARAQGADSRVRQNLALAHALAGDWAAARTIAAQDLSADLVDARVQQWMALAKPAHAYDQVAALVGVSPAAADPGQPVRLALVQGDTRVAEAAPAPAPVQVVAEAANVPTYETPVSQPDALAPAPAPEVPTVREAVASAAAISPEAPAAYAMASNFAPKPKPAKAKKPAAARPSLGSAKGVVQLGAFSSEERVSLAWDKLTRRFPTLRNYSPVSARFDGPRGTVYRLSIRGFANQQEAISRCQILRGKGGSCFVRSTAGDSPIQFASR
ncbi:tetratricopeptide repeat protein [Sphingomonas sediminicola]|uniref:Tetratricopeptide repeat protein n=2 Tax=Sphingomonas sediminicola TaxID=386874 RepID=A0ABX6TCA0_9SPHN|nr:tetratricopeptide repeat protein [Sphingomonas sediminicola]